MLKITAMCAAVALTLSGCVSTRTAQLPESAVQGLKGQPVVLAVRAKPDFGAMTAGKATFGMFGALAMISEGNKIVADNAIEDPALQLGHSLLETIVATDGAVAGPPGTALASGDDTAKLAGLYAKSPYVLDVFTVNWSYAYYPLSWSHYRVIYSVKAKLVDTHTKTALAEAFCARSDNDEPHAPTQEELLANKAERLKAMLHEHAQSCLGELQQKLLALKS